jgi:hypothetical protein
MSSIYRPKHSVAIPEADTAPARPVIAKARPSQQPRTWEESEWAGRRKAQPAQVILAATRHWMNSLPPDYRPQSLAIRFPRIANLIAASWGNPKECSAYLYSLLHDQRGGRKGFPVEVQKDITDLRVYFAMLHPIINWDEGSDPPIRR